MREDVLLAVLRRIENKLTDFEAKLAKVEDGVQELVVNGLRVSLNIEEESPDEDD